jgi:hypothetical protein
VGDDDDDDVPVTLGRAARGGSRSASSSGAAPVGAAMEAALKVLVTDGSLVLAEDAELRGLANRLLTFLENLDTPHIGRAIGEWLLDQDEVDELYADDSVVVETIRKSMPQK